MAEKIAEGVDAQVATLDGCDLMIAGQAFRCLTFSSRPVAGAGRLTRSEREVAYRAAQGETARQIAAARRTSKRTVDHQLASVFRKLGIASRNELAAAAFAGEGHHDLV